MRRKIINIKNQEGFTLVELLVVITIIAVLAVVGITAFSGAQQSARDGRRKADIEAYAKAFESKFDATTGVYTAPVAADFAAGTFPTDPSTGVAYAPTVGTGTYCVCALLEKTGTGNSNTGCTMAAPLNYYCMRNQQ